MNIRFTLSMLLLASALGMSAQRKATKKAVAKPAAKVDAMSARQSKLFEEMLDNTQKLFVIDSVVVDRSQAVNAIALPADLGRMVPYEQMFKDGQGKGAYVYINGFGNKCYFALSDTTGTSKMFVCEKLGTAWSAPQQIKGLDSSLRHISYPFMTSNGETMYFAAKSDTEGLGGYDIYMTRYDADEGTFLEAENVGLPYNSTDDDFLYADDDVHGFAWLATTRRQPEGKACIYIIKTAKKRTNYDADDYDERKLTQLAKLTRIRETWPTPQQRDEAMKQLAALRSTGGSSDTVDGTAFVVNDELTVDGADGLTHAESRTLYAQLTKLQQQQHTIATLLDNLRLSYRNGTQAAKAKTAESIVANEKALETVTEQIRDITYKIRKTENN